MTGITDALASTISVITAMGALGTSAFGLVDSSKSFWGGVSRVGFSNIERALKPFQSALEAGSPFWRDTVFANWLNGVAKDDQKAAVKNLIRLGISSRNATELAASGHVDPAAFQKALVDLEKGIAASPEDLQLIGRFNAVVDAALDAGFERAEQAYRNVSKAIAGLVATALAVWAGYLLQGNPLVSQVDTHQAYFGSPLFAWAVFVGLISVPIAPMAKDLASSLQAAAAAAKAPG